MNFAIAGMSLILTVSLVLVLSRAWQMALLALLVQYLVVGIFLSNHIPAVQSGLYIFVGALICLVLYLTARQTCPSPTTVDWPVVDRLWIAETLFRLAAVVLTGVGVFGSALPAFFPMLPPDLVLLSAWLVAIGLVLILVAREILLAGIGFMTLVSGLEILYTTIDPRVTSVGLMAIGTLLLALGTAVVMTLRATP